MTWRLHFQLLLHWRVEEGATQYLGLLHFTLDLFSAMLSVKQGGIMYYFLSFSCDSTWDWTPISRSIGEHSTHNANNSSQIKLYFPLRYCICEMHAFCTILYFKVSTFKMNSSPLHSLDLKFSLFVIWELRKYSWASEW